MTLEEGDVILTGTPQGVGPVEVGDIITAGLKDKNDTTCNITFLINKE